MNVAIVHEQAFSTSFRGGIIVLLLALIKCKMAVNVKHINLRRGEILLEKIHKIQFTVGVDMLKTKNNCLLCIRHDSCSAYLFYNLCSAGKDNY